MGNLVIVAIPEKDDYVWKISSEKIPHMTIIFLGETSSVDNVGKISEFVEHAAEMSLYPFGLSVDYRGELGPDRADVLFFKKDPWEFERIAQFRAYLLQENNIFKAHNAIPQYEEWTPHLTLGYPETPAKKDDRDYPGIHYVHFDRIGVWFGDYQGFEFRLTYPEWPSLEVAMGTVDTGAGAVEEILQHYGVKGMHWGVRKERSPQAVTVRTRTGGQFTKTKIKTRGGRSQPADPDAVLAKITLQEYKKSGPAALSNKDLQVLQTRLNLEANVDRLVPSNYQKIRKGSKFAKAFADTPQGKQAIGYASKTAAAAAVRKKLASMMVKAAVVA